MLKRFRPLIWPTVFVLLAAALYNTRIKREMVDFEVYRTAASRAWHAEPLYREADGHYQFKYLPAFALAMTPFALVDREAAKAIWFALSAGLLTAFVRWSVRGLPERRRAEPTLIALAVLFMVKFYAHELTLGQTNIVLGTLLMGGLLAAQVDQPALAGVLMGAAAFIKPYALLLLPWLAVSYGSAAALASVGVLVAGLALPAAFYGWNGNAQLLVQWFQTVTGSTSGNLIGADNVSLAAMWAKWLGIGTLATGLSTITSGLVLALVAVVWVRRRGLTNPDYLEFALLMLVIPLLSPQGWDYVLLLGTPAVVILLDRWNDVSRAWRVGTVVALSMMGLTLFDLMGRRLYGEYMALSLVSVAALLTAFAMVHLRWKSIS
ncbi:MAG: glycosyltransferase family 87 protein [Acidobacteriota bacterium]